MVFQIPQARGRLTMDQAIATSAQLVGLGCQETTPSPEILTSLRIRQLVSELSLRSKLRFGHIPSLGDRLYQPVA
jgi:hypothetical protein